jgi:hypothetical protein
VDWKRQHMKWSITCKRQKKFYKKWNFFISHVSKLFNKSDKCFFT